MPEPRQAFTLQDLRRLLIAEVTRADISLAQVQTAAILDCAQEWPAEMGMIDPGILSINSLQIRFGLMPVCSPWYTRLYHWLRRSPPSPGTPQFRFAHAGDGSATMQFVCELRRNGGKPFDGEVTRG